MYAIDGQDDGQFGIVPARASHNSQKLVTFGMGRHQAITTLETLPLRWRQQRRRHG